MAVEYMHACCMLNKAGCTNYFNKFIEILRLLLPLLLLLLLGALNRAKLYYYYVLGKD